MSCSLVECYADMENVMSVLSAACVKFQTWGKLLVLNIDCFVENVLSVAILLVFSKTLGFM